MIAILSSFNSFNQFSILFPIFRETKIIAKKVSCNFRNEISPPIIRFLPVTRLEFAAPRRGERRKRGRGGRTSFRGAHTCVSTKIRSLNTGRGWNSSGSRHVPREPRHVRRFTDSSRILRLRRRDYVASPFKTPVGFILLAPFPPSAALAAPFCPNWTEIGWRIEEVNGVIMMSRRSLLNPFCLFSGRKGTLLGFGQFKSSGCLVFWYLD